MIIILDTNIILQDRWFKGNAFNILLEKHLELKIDIYIPKIVIDEVINKYREELTEINNNLKNAITNYKKLTFSNLDITTLNIEEEIKKYIKYIDDILKKYEIKVIDYPKISHEIIVKKLFEKRKPFKENGTGYRDCLIWQNVQEIHKKSIEKVVFITQNSSDFGKEEKLHKDLIEQLRIPERVLYLNSLTTFNENYILSTLEKLENYSDYSLFMEKWLEENINNIIKENDILYSIYSNETRVECNIISNIIKGNIKYDDVKVINKNEILFNVSSSYKFTVEITYDFNECPEWYEKERHEYLGFEETLIREAELYLYMSLLYCKSENIIKKYDVVEFGDLVSDVRMKYVII